MSKSHGIDNSVTSGWFCDKRKGCQDAIFDSCDKKKRKEGKKNYNYLSVACSFNIYTTLY